MTTYDRTKAINIIRAARLSNAGLIFDEAVDTGLPLQAACAVIEKETRGTNEYGHDAIRDAQGNVKEWGMLSGFPDAPNADNFAAFWYMVNTKGALSNGVGPTQITSRSLLAEMIGQGLNPWDPADNMHYGFARLLGYYAAAKKAGDPHPWITAGRIYNGGLSYGQDLAHKVEAWRQLLAPAAI